MKKAQIKVFEELLKDENFKGKDQLAWLLWRNTTEPKYKVGENYTASGRGQYVYGHPVKNFKATIKRSYCYKTEKAWYYELEAVCICGEKEHKTTIFCAEYNIGKKCTDNINNLGKAKNEYAETMDI
jgi:hypothetical protein